MNVVVIGAQWGDEGKGKIVDYLSSEVQKVVRFSGGANAGHTIVDGDKTYKLHLVPSGIIYPDTVVILGTGMVIDPEALFAELEELERQGISWEGRVLISDRAHLVLPSHRREDIQREEERENPIGTTGRGIGVAYAHKAYRDGVRLADLAWPRHLASLATEDQEFLETWKDRLLPLTVDLASYMHTGVPREDERVLLEGAQGALLDIDLGTYPYVSSGASCSGGALSGAALGPGDIDHVLGVFKAYSTRVGNGPFPSEFDGRNQDGLEEHIRELGREYGVTTGRPRRIGYLDLVALRYACRTNGITSLALTHLDVYDALETVTACIGYETDHQTLDYFPASIALLERARPVTKAFPGWQRPLGDISSFEDLPREARDYITFIEDYLEVPISLVSVGYQRNQTIIRRSLWGEK
ncbi:adenylosuccinate synthetase [Alkalispirochaeta sphaeroplastigenens]|uniref:Adenylosuccinate synthetase n=1 Tax=Alkalispirochaeta sphaeroplastigenens TaxID=1187066 RepID=A0A2S4K0G2_9SPIO|nr:adenylosuccinate synthase [Alkalispirochaeta sphaeroplastigenens]POR05247.1 adenylosuccinate synthetase [Alkalispirochaeta sphaeroplastigenens]